MSSIDSTEAEREAALILVDFIELGEHVPVEVMEKIKQAHVVKLTGQIEFLLPDGARLFMKHGKAWIVRPIETGWSVTIWIHEEASETDIPRSAFPFGAEPFDTE